jgi:ZIP family zinc transporter
VFEAGLWAALGQSALIVGALLVARYPRLTEPRWLGLVMAFGAGALISAVTTDLVAEAYAEAGRAPAGVGLLVGAGGYYLLTRWLDRRAEREDPEEPVEEAEDVAGPTAVPAAADATAARNLTVGMVLDGIPESIAVGLTLLGGASVSFALVGAVFLSNLPEAIGVAAALLAGGIPLRKVLVRFGAIVAVGFVAGLVGYAVLKPTNADAIAVI